MVSGIFILFTIVSPVIMKFNGNVGLDVEKYNNLFKTESVVETKEVASAITDKNVMKVYKENLTRNIKSGIENLNYVVKSINLEIDEYKNYGDIKKIYLQVENVTLVPEIKVENVEINVNSNEETEKVTSDNSESKNGIKENDKNIIKEFLNKNYRINSSNIVIN